MLTNDVTYDQDIENMIISNLDGWIIETETSNTETSENEDINPFMTSAELENKANKVITRAECELFYEEALDMAYIHTNRFNIDDLTDIEARIFTRAVCKLCASNLWNKYNIRVSNEDLEDTYIQSYGGLLYHNALKMLQQFVNQKITGLTRK